MAKHIKRSSRRNPREDRNFSEPKLNYKTSRTSRTIENKTSNIIDFPNVPKKKHIEIIPRNLNQENLLAALENDMKHIVFATGPAGCGKTLLTTLMGIKMLRSGQVHKIVITRPNVAVDDKDIGFLPGDILKKMTPWMMPILDVFAEYYTQKEIVTMLEENVIEIVPIAFIRGRTFKSAYIIIDEAQGTTPNSMLSILTRIGENSKLVITGDLNQSDRGLGNGLGDFLQRFTSSNHIEIIQFKHTEVERHPVIKEILTMYGQS